MCHKANYIQTCTCVQQCNAISCVGIVQYTQHVTIVCSECKKKKQEEKICCPACSKGGVERGCVQDVRRCKYDFLALEVFRFWRVDRTPVITKYFFCLLMSFTQLFVTFNRLIVANKRQKMQFSLQCLNFFILTKCENVPSLIHNRNSAERDDNICWSLTI